MTENIAFAKRWPSPPKIVVPVLYTELAMEIFEATMKQEPEYGDDVVDGYVSAEVYQNHQEFWTRLRKLAAQGVVWLPEETMQLYHLLREDL